ncbi:MAG: hypothetical protein DWQ42_12185 [Planctomycetota bacterium]|nr:MAG: hypothetical protein DWQ42_12185 [Planctomycetota bacterium]REK40514.1 MAG: hypothetical protein DWQ46_16115 [Planctomycetota bacterium]
MCEGADTSPLPVRDIFSRPRGARAGGKMTVMNSSVSTSIVDSLLEPQIYPDAPQRVELRETHISWVFLTDHHAYKLKKPVQFDFLDFSTPEARRQACEEELRLNRRLSQGIYLDVVPVRLNTKGEHTLRGQGPVVDYLVKMRRLDEATTLKSAIARGQRDARRLASLVDRLAEFYQSLAPVTLRPEEYRASIEAHVQANFEVLSRMENDLPDELLDRVRAAQRQFLRLSAGLLDERVCDGRIVEGHGDLRPEHIYLERDPQIIDCIEFDRDFRVLDVADELSFLAMECERLGAADVGDALLRDYSQRCQDRLDDRLLNFYKAYRATVRAKVAALRAGQMELADGASAHHEALEYLTLAGQYARRIAQPCLIVVRGLVGTGKTTLACELARVLEASLIRTDVVRMELFPHVSNGSTAATGTSSGKSAEDSRYQPEQRKRVYEEVLRRAARVLAAGRVAVVDGTFLSGEAQDAAIRTARKQGAPLLLVTCQCPAEVAEERIRHRLAKADDASEARPELHRQQAAESVDDARDRDGLPAIEVDTTNALAGQREQVLQALATAEVSIY